MLTPQQVARIVRLADEGFSRRSISIATGIARNTVRRILERRRHYRHCQFTVFDLLRDETPGERHSATADSTPAEDRNLHLAEAPPNELDENGLYDVKRPVFTRPPERCPGCGGVCYMPCLACRVRKRQAKQKAQAKSAPQ